MADRSVLGLLRFGVMSSLLREIGGKELALALVHARMVELTRAAADGDTEASKRIIGEIGTVLEDAMRELLEIVADARKLDAGMVH